MFKFIFRTITMIMFLSFAVIVLAVWKGGDPFRTLGLGITEAGHIISRFGDFVDDVKRGGEKVHKTYDQLRDTLTDDTISPAKEK